MTEDQTEDQIQDPMTETEEQPVQEAPMNLEETLVDAAKQALAEPQDKPDVILELRKTVPVLSSEDSNEVRQAMEKGPVPESLLEQMKLKYAVEGNLGLTVLADGSVTFIYLGEAPKSE